MVQEQPISILDRKYLDNFVYDVRAVTLSSSFPGRIILKMRVTLRKPTTAFALVDFSVGSTSAKGKLRVLERQIESTNGTCMLQPKESALVIFANGLELTEVFPEEIEIGGW